MSENPGVSEAMNKIILDMVKDTDRKMMGKLNRKEIRKKLRAKAKEVHYQDKLLAEWMNQLADKI